MVEHELNVRREVGERDRLVDLIGTHAEIEWPAGSLQPPHIFAKQSAPSLSSSGVTCSTRRKPFTNGLASCALEESRKIRALRTAGADRAANQAKRERSASEATFSLSRLDIVLGDIDLHVQRVRHAATARLERIELDSEKSALSGAKPSSQG